MSNYLADLCSRSRDLGSGRGPFRAGVIRVLLGQSSILNPSSATADYHRLARNFNPDFASLCTGRVHEMKARCGVHVSTMFRRTLWAAVGGFDPALPAYEDTDFWLSALERGFIGDVIKEPLLRYRVRSGSRYGRGLDPEIYLSSKRSILQKHSPSVSQFGPEILSQLICFESEQTQHFQHLTREKSRLERELIDLRAAVEKSAAELRATDIAPINLGDFHHSTPFQIGAAVAGGKNSETVLEYYTRTFLDQHRSELKGTILSLLSPSSRSLDPALFKKESLDCIVLGDSLREAPDLHAALSNWQTLLKPGATLFATLPCISSLSKNTTPIQHDSWRFTEASARALFAECFPLENFEVTPRGNLIACSATLYDLPANSLQPGELEPVDPLFPLLICVRAVNATPSVLRTPGPSKASASSRSRRSFPPSNSPPRNAPVQSSLILLYHRIAHLAPDPHGLCVSPDAFASQMEHLARYYFPMPLEELAAAGCAGRIPPGAVAVTFDDGYLDNFEAASRILQKTGVPATFFANTDRFDQEHEAWWDEIEQVLSSDRLPDHLSIVLRDQKFECKTENSTHRASALQQLHTRLLHLSAQDRSDAVTATSADARGTPSEPIRSTIFCSHLNPWKPSVPKSLKVNKRSNAFSTCPLEPFPIPTANLTPIRNSLFSRPVSSGPSLSNYRFSGQTLARCAFLASKLNRLIPYPLSSSCGPSSLHDHSIWGKLSHTPVSILHDHLPISLREKIRPNTTFGPKLGNFSEESK